MTYVLAGVPRLTICATSLSRRAVTPLVVRITALSELGVVRSEMFVVVEALLRFQVLVCGTARWNNDCLDLHDDGVGGSDGISLVEWRAVDEGNDEFVVGQGPSYPNRTDTY
jgi:hypothetical protein